MAKRNPVSFRVTDEVLSGLKKRAASSGRSLSQEIEFRCETALYADDLRQIIREEIRAALGTGTGGFPLVDHAGGEMIAVNAEGRVTSPKHLADKGVHLCEPPWQSHSPIPVNAAVDPLRSTNDQVRAAIANAAEQLASRRPIFHHPV